MNSAYDLHSNVNQVLPENALRSYSTGASDCSGMHDLTNLLQ